MPFSKGDLVTVFNNSLTGKPVIEGRARIIKPTGQNDQYLVAFLSDARPQSCSPSERYIRFVYEEGQDDPEAWLVELTATWRSFRVDNGMQPEQCGLVEGVERDMARLGL